jgi:hypothetical protein
MADLTKYLPTCFVIQPFDKGVFDKRYDDVFAPAIEAAGLQPYRVDRDRSTVIPVEDIEAGIRNSFLCFAEISLDNPNVWYELGFARAAGKHVELLCTQPRDKFPFDIQHRYVIRSPSQSPSDFAALSEEITSRLLNAIERIRNLDNISALKPTIVSDGLSQIEVALLVVTAQRPDPDGTRSEGAVRDEMENAGFNSIGITLATRSLRKKGFLDTHHVDDWNQEYTAYRVTEEAFDWLERNQSLLTFHTPKPPAIRDPLSPPDDVPF